MHRFGHISHMCIYTLTIIIIIVIIILIDILVILGLMNLLFYNSFYAISLVWWLAHCFTFTIHLLIFLHRFCCLLLYVSIVPIISFVFRSLFIGSVGSNSVVLHVQRIDRIRCHSFRCSSRYNGYCSFQISS